MGTIGNQHISGRRLQQLVYRRTIQTSPNRRLRQLGTEPRTPNDAPRRPLQNARFLERRRGRTHSGMGTARGARREYENILGTGVESRKNLPMETQNIPPFGNSAANLRMPYRDGTRFRRSWNIHRVPRKNPAQNRSRRI